MPRFSYADTEEVAEIIRNGQPGIDCVCPQVIFAQQAVIEISPLPRCCRRCTRCRSHYTTWPDAEDKDVTLNNPFFRVTSLVAILLVHGIVRQKALRECFVIRKS